MTDIPTYGRVGENNLKMVRAGLFKGKQILEHQYFQIITSAKP